MRAAKVCAPYAIDIIQVHLADFSERQLRDCERKTENDRQTEGEQYEEYLSHERYFIYSRIKMDRMETLLISCELASESQQVTQ